MTENGLCVMQKLRISINVPPWQKFWEDVSLPSTSGLLSLTSGSRKNKRTELDDRRLTLCHAKVGGTKALVSPLAKMLGGRVPISRVLRP